MLRLPLVVLLLGLDASSTSAQFATSSPADSLLMVGSAVWVAPMPAEHRAATAGERSLLVAGSVVGVATLIYVSGPFAVIGAPAGIYLVSRSFGHPILAATCCATQRWA